MNLYVHFANPASKETFPLHTLTFGPFESIGLTSDAYLSGSNSGVRTHLAFYDSTHSCWEISLDTSDTVLTFTCLEIK